MKSRVKKLLKLIERKSLRKFVKYVTEKKINLDMILFDPESGENLGSCLHLACQHDRDDILRYLIRREVDAGVLDVRGNPAVYSALKRAVFTDNEVFVKLVQLLIKYAPDALGIVNTKGRNGHELLEEWYRTEKTRRKIDDVISDVSEDEGERWEDKLHTEAESEYQQQWGAYEDDYCAPDQEPETASDWAERISRQHKRKTRPLPSTPRLEKQTKLDESQSREFTERLERHHRQYVERMSKLRERRIQKNKKSEYSDKWSELKTKAVLSFTDIPWPDLDQLESFVLGDSDRSDLKLCRTLLREEQVRWHPDKFTQKFGGQIVEQDKTKVCEKVKVISQEMNALSEKFAAT